MLLDGLRGILHQSGFSSPTPTSGSLTVTTPLSTVFRTSTLIESLSTATASQTDTSIAIATTSLSNAETSNPNTPTVHQPLELNTADTIGIAMGITTFFLMMLLLYMFTRRRARVSDGFANVPNGDTGNHEVMIVPVDPQVSKLASDREISQRQINSSAPQNQTGSSTQIYATDGGSATSVSRVSLTIQRIVPSFNTTGLPSPRVQTRAAEVITNEDTPSLPARGRNSPTTLYSTQPPSYAEFIGPNEVRLKGGPRRRVP